MCEDFDIILARILEVELCAFSRPAFDAVSLCVYLMHHFRGVQIVRLSCAGMVVQFHHTSAILLRVAGMVSQYGAQWIVGWIHVGRGLEPCQSNCFAPEQSCVGVDRRTDLSMSRSVNAAVGVEDGCIVDHKVVWLLSICRILNSNVIRCALQNAPITYPSYPSICPSHLSRRHHHHLPSLSTSAVSDSSPPPPSSPDLPPSSSSPLPHPDPSQPDPDS